MKTNNDALLAAKLVVLRAPARLVELKALATATLLMLAAVKATGPSNRSVPMTKSVMVSIPGPMRESARARRNVSERAYV